MQRQRKKNERLNEQANEQLCTEHTYRTVYQKLYTLLLNNREHKTDCIINRETKKK